MDYSLLIAIIVSVVITYKITKWLIEFFREVGLVVKDQNKEKKPLIPLSGGIPVFLGFFIGILVYSLFNAIVGEGSYFGVFGDYEIAVIYASLFSILWATIIGFFDDAFIYKSNEKSYGLKQWQKPLITLIGALPLMLVLLNRSTIGIPYFGEVSVGWLYPLLLIPIGYVGATNMVNLLAGFNGLEAGLGMIYVLSLGLYAYVSQSFVAALIAMIAFPCIAVFYFFNRFPAKIFPGDSLTYFMGSVFAILAIVGELEVLALIVAIPYFVEFLLKWRSKFTADSFGIWINGKILSKYEKIYAIPHIFTRSGNYNEKQIVNFILLIQLFFALIIWFI